MHNRNKIFRMRAVIFTVAFLFIVLFANLLISKIVDTYPVKIDVTSDGRFTLSEESIDVLSKLDKTVDVYLIESGKYPMDRDVAEVIDRYRKYADGKINVISKDIVTDYAFAQKYDGNISYGYIVFECGEVSKLEYALDLLSDDDMLYTAENTITNDIIYVSSDANSLVYSTIGHNEDDSGSMTTALNSENYTFKSVDLLRDPVPGDATLLNIVGPKKDFDLTEIAKLNDFLSDGGSIQIYLDPGTTGLINLYKFAEDWGIEITDNYIEERDSDRIDITSRDLMLPHIAQYAFTEGLFDETSTLVLKNVHSLGYIEDNPKGAQNIIGILYTSDKAISRRNANSPNAKTGEHYMAVMSTKYQGSTESNLYVLGTTSIFDSAYFEEGSRYSNRDFFLKSVGWMCGFKDSIKISSKRAHSDILGLSLSDGIKYTILIFAVSIIILAFGIVVWARRRYL